MDDIYFEFFKNFLKISYFIIPDFSEITILFLLFFFLFQSSSLGQMNCYVSGLKINNNNYNFSVQKDSLGTRDIQLTPFSNLGNNILHSITGTENILLQFAGIASTYAISSTNIDSRASTYFRDHDQYAQYAGPAVTLDETLPITTGAFLYILGKISSDNQMVGASYAVLQTGLITLGYISLLKAITGRAYPKANDAPSDRRLVSQTFHYGFLRDGVYHGWPSGHTGAAMAVASSLSHYYPDKTWLKILSYSWVAYSAASVTVNHKGTMHWFSDAIAACFMTYSIGKSVGNFYRGKITNNEENVRFRILPVVDSDYTGIYLTYKF
jgi:membrane-associated phospholipid phosphatase